MKSRRMPKREGSKMGLVEHLPDSRADQAHKEAVLAIDDAYREDAREFVRFLDSHRLPIGYEGLVAWAEYLRSSHYAAATINKRLAGAKNRVRFLFRSSPQATNLLAKYKLDSSLADIHGVKLNSRKVDLHKVLSLRQLRSLATSAKVPLRVRLFIEFFAITGLRVSELCRIWTADIKTDHDVCSVRILGKGQKERQIKVRRELIDRVRACFQGKRLLFESRGGKPYTRQHVSRAVRVAGELVLERRISAHTLRHTFATLQIRRTRKVKGVSVYMGHSSTSMTQDMYVHEELDLDELALDLGRRQ